MASRSTSSTIKKLEFASSPQRWVPEKYQQRAVKWLLSNAGAALFLDPGLGKTSITLKALSVLLKSGVARKILIIAPKRVCKIVWPGEIKKWEDFNHLTHVVLQGPKKDERIRQDVDIYLCNPENLEWLLENLNKINPDTLVVDESTKFKSSSSLRFKLLRDVLHKFARRWILTGTPMPNGLMDLWAQAYIVDLGHALGRFITHYRNKWFYQTGYGGYTWAPEEGAEVEIFKAMRKFALRLDEADYLTLPPVRQNYIHVELDDAARKVYDKMEDELIVEVNTKGKAYVVVAVSNGVAQGKCRQIAGGALYTQMDRRGLPMSQQYATIHTEKIDALRDLVEELQGQPLLVMFQFQHELDRLRKAFKKFPCIGHGPGKDEDLCDLWNEGKLPLLGAHPSSIAHGLNLQFGGNNLCWFSETWNAEEQDQVLRRLRRRGTKYSFIMEHHIVARNTLDEVMIASGRRKQGGQRDFLEMLRQYRKARGRTL